MLSESSDEAQLLALLPLINRTVISSFNPKDVGYTKTQILIFFALSRCGELTMTQVAGYISSSKEQATRAVIPLVEEGMVERSIPQENRTRVYIRLTEQGSKLMEQWKSQFHQRIQDMLNDRITPEEKQNMIQATNMLIQILSKLSE